ncbi:MAG: serine/threonine-protein kinase [Myxococcota bacterium]|jgi:serine/threonine-protein kinase|nr:serine/threonine-protein kinase [Myxococcota bacterium]
MRSCPICRRGFPDTAVQCPDDGSRLFDPGVPPDSTDRFLGRVLGGRYRLDQRLGAGSVGVVFLGLDLASRQPVAIKLLMPRGFAEPRAARRLKREFRALSQLDNPHIVKAYELSETEEGIPFLAMEFISGKDLDQLLEEEGWLAPGRTLHLAVQIVDALATAHAHGIIHRDLKPDNIHLTTWAGDPDYVKVLDFGLVKFFQVGDGHPTALTAAHLVVGTPHYMAPEQIRGGEVGPWTDLYALGTLLYRAQAGILPFPGSEPVKVMGAHCRQAPLPPSQHNPSIPQDLEILILDLLEKDPAFRPRSAAIVRDRLTTGELGRLWEQARPRPPRSLTGPSPGALAARPPAATSLLAWEVEKTQDLPADYSWEPQPPASPATARDGADLSRFVWLILLVWGIAALTAVLVATLLLSAS